MGRINGDKIREERLKIKLTQEEFAETIDLSYSYLGHVERGERGLSVEKLADIAEYFGLLVDDLLYTNKKTLRFLQEKLVNVTQEMDNDKIELLIKIADAIK